MFAQFDKVIPIEEMGEAFMLDRLGIDVNQKDNSTDRPSYIEYLSTDTLSALNRLYREDFACFGYERHEVVPAALMLSPSSTAS
jgi:hypothetical protein